MIAVRTTARKAAAATSGAPTTGVVMTVTGVTVPGAPPGRAVDFVGTTRAVMAVGARTSAGMTAGPAAMTRAVTIAGSGAMTHEAEAVDRDTPAPSPS